MGFVVLERCGVHAGAKARRSEIICLHRDRIPSGTTWRAGNIVHK